MSQREQREVRKVRKKLIVKHKGCPPASDNVDKLKSIMKVTVS